MEKDLTTTRAEAAKVAGLVAQVNTLTPLAGKVPGLEKDLTTTRAEAAKVAGLVAQVNDLKPLADQVPDLKKDLNAKNNEWVGRAEVFKNAAQKQLDAVVRERNASVKSLGEENLKLATALVVAQRVVQVDTRSAKERQRDAEKQGEATPQVTQRERSKAPSKPPVTPTPTVFVPEPEPVQVKSMFERLKASMFAFLTELKARALGETVIEAADNATCVGPVVLVDDVRAFQKTGKSTYTAHELAKLDRVPGVDQPKMEIQYKDGRGVVSGRDGVGGSGVGR